MSTMLFRIGMFMISWTSIMLLPKKEVKKYLPVTFFSASILLTETVLSTVFKWWKVKGGQKSLIINALSFIFGPFFAINIWIFHFTKNKFFPYVLVNLVFDLLFAYPLNILFQKVGFYKLTKFKSIHLFLTAFLYSFANYWFHNYIVSEKNKGNAS